MNRMAPTYQSRGRKERVKYWINENLCLSVEDPPPPESIKAKRLSGAGWWLLKRNALTASRWWETDEVEWEWWGGERRWILNWFGKLELTKINSIEFKLDVMYVTCSVSWSLLWVCECVWVCVREGKGGVRRKGRKYGRDSYTLESAWRRAASPKSPILTVIFSERNMLPSLRSRWTMRAAWM